MKKYSRREFLPLAGLAVVATSCLSVDGKESPDPTIPLRLKRGDTIGICAPSGAVKDAYEVDQFCDVLQALGFKVKKGKNVYQRFGYFSANDTSRAEEFMELIVDPDVNAVFTVRGGWGCARLLPYLDFNQIQRNPKVIMGFSDFTTLLNAITTKTGLITFHGPSGNSSWNDYSVNYLERLLMNAEKLEFKNSHLDEPVKTLSSGKAQGELYGGNLSVISSVVGSNFLPDWKGKIVFLEEVNEEPYRVDRMLTHLRLNGVFEQISGLVLGSFNKCEAEEPEFSFTLDEVFEQHFGQATFPVYQGAQFGHVRNKFTLPIGTMAEMDADQGSIRLIEAAVR